MGSVNHCFVSETTFTKMNVDKYHFTLHVIRSFKECLMVLYLKDLHTVYFNDLSVRFWVDTFCIRSVSVSPCPPPLPHYPPLLPHTHRVTPVCSVKERLQQQQHREKAT